MPRKSFDGEPRLLSLNMKTTKDLRERMERAASETGRALTHEVEVRLNRTFDYDYVLGDSELAHVLRAIGTAVRRFEINTGKSFAEDEATGALCYEVALKVLDALMKPETVGNALQPYMRQATEQERAAEEIRRTQFDNHLRIAAIDAALDTLNEQKNSLEKETAQAKKPGRRTAKSTTG